MLDAFGAAGSPDIPGASAEGALAPALILEQNIGGLGQVGIIIRVARHLDDAPLACHAHAASPSSLGSRIRL